MLGDAHLPASPEERLEWVRAWLKHGENRKGGAAAGEKAGGSRNAGGIGFDRRAAGGGRGASLDEIAGRLSPPEFALIGEELLLRFRDDERAVVIPRMQNYTIDEIAERMTCLARTVQRTLEGVRRRWTIE